MIIKCQIKQCQEVIKVEETTAPDVKFTCRKHTGDDQVNQDLSFQRHSFDRKLKGHRP